MDRLVGHWWCRGALGRIVRAATNAHAMLATLAVGCSESLREPPRAPPPTHAAESIVVAYPPPPAQIERVVEDPGEPCVWIDGHWWWNARRWRWQSGGWVQAPAQCYYSWPMMVFLPGETESPLYYWPPRWYPSAGTSQSGCAPVTLCPQTAATETEAESKSAR